MKRLLAPLALLLTASAHAQVSDYVAFEQAGKPAPAASGATPTLPAGNVVTLFSNRADWFAGTNVAVLETFEAGLTPPGELRSCNEPVSVTSNDDCFEPGDLVGGFQLQLGEDGPRDPQGKGGGEFVVLGDGFIGQSSAVIGPNSFDDFTDIVFTSGDANAVGFDAYSGAEGGGLNEGVAAAVLVRIYDTSGNLVDALSYPTSDFNIPVFVGFISPVAIGHVEVEGAGGSGELIDGLAFGPAGAEIVPVPASGGLALWLLAALLAVGGMVYLGRR